MKRKRESPTAELLDRLLLLSPTLESIDTFHPYIFAARDFTGCHYSMYTSALTIRSHPDLLQYMVDSREKVKGQRWFVDDVGRVLAIDCDGSQEGKRTIWYYDALLQ